MQSLPVKLYGHRIKVHASPYPNSQIIEELSWDLLPFKTYSKFNWYFEYRYALLRVKYPFNCIEKFIVHQDPTPEYEAFRLKNKIIAKKRKITEAKNKLQIIKDNWTYLFPIEDDTRYQNTINKINQLESELEVMVKSVESDNL